MSLESSARKTRSAEFNKGKITEIEDKDYEFLKKNEIFNLLIEQGVFVVIETKEPEKKKGKK